MGPDGATPYSAFGAQPTTQRPWWIAALIGVVCLQSVTLALVLQQGRALQSLEGSVAHPAVTTKAVAHEDIRGTILEKPKKLLLGGLTPPADQGFRGDCWLFALTGILEDSYVRYGVQKGWLQSGTFLKLSRQALGIRVMAECRARPSAMCPATVSENGEIGWGNTTNFGDERMLYFIKTLQRDALPDSVCPYRDMPVGEAICDGLTSALLTNRELTPSRAPCAEPKPPSRASTHRVHPHPDNLDHQQRARQLADARVRIAPSQHFAST